MFCLEISVVVLFISLVPKKVVYLLQVLSDKFCPLCEYSNHMITAAGVWTDCQLEINQFYWARQSGVDERQHAMNNKVIDFYFLVWSLSRLLWHVTLDSNVAIPLVIQ